jgi:hypothetical protein
MATTSGLLEKKRKEDDRIELETLSDSTRCSRCRGLMVIEHRFDSMVGTGAVDVSLRRCVQCGEVIDPVILQNRRSQLRGALK